MNVILWLLIEYIRVFGTTIVSMTMNIITFKHMRLRLKQICLERGTCILNTLFQNNCYPLM